VDDGRVAEVGHAVDVVDAGHGVDAGDEQERDGRRREREEERQRDEPPEHVAGDGERRRCGPERLPGRPAPADGEPREEAERPEQRVQSHATTPARTNVRTPASRTTRRPARASATVGGSASGFST